MLKNKKTSINADLHVDYTGHCQCVQHLNFQKNDEDRIYTTLFIKANKKLQEIKINSSGRVL